MPRSLLLPPLLLLIALAGCGGGTNATDKLSGDESKVALLVSDFNEAKGNAAKLKPLFADAPGRPKDYEKRDFAVPLGAVKVSGETATATVEIRKEEDAKLIATTEWSFVKVGGQWKIKSAPLQ